MKLTLKVLLGAFGLLAAGHAATAAVAPTFSTADAPAYYQVKFTVGNHVLKDDGLNANNAAKPLITADPNWNDNCRWQLIGSASGFKMKSAAGHYVGFSNSRFAAVATEADAVTLRINDLGECCEIGRTTSSTYLNQWGGTGVGVQLGEWTSGDNNNKLNFVEYAAAPPEPEFSDAGTEVWYYIQFRQNGSVITSNGIGANVTREVMVRPESTKVWKLVGDKTNFQIVNKKGEYLAPNAAGTRLAASASPYAPGYALAPGQSSAHFPSWEIAPNGMSGKYLNLWDGAGSAAKEVGFYGSGAGENGNALAFRPIDEIAPSEFVFEGSATYRPANKLSLWYTRPATSSDHPHPWMDLGLPVGNGQLGAMVLGGVLREDISVNEKTLWSGRKEDNGYSYGCYQNFGSLMVESLPEEGFDWEGNNVLDYWRNLDLTDASVNVSYRNSAGTTFTRKYIASYPDNVVAVMMTADKPGAVNLKFTEDPGMAPQYVTVPVSYSADGTITYGGKFETLSFRKCVKIVPTGGTMTADESGITVKGADKIYIVIAAGTDYDPLASNYTSGTESLASNITATATNAVAKGWESVLSDQVADYKTFFDRVAFDLTGSENAKPTDELIEYYQKVTGTNINVDDANVRFLEQLYFHYGRYLHIGSSRGVDLPNNLQGIWSGYTFKRPHSGGQIAPWNADIHNNINLQMCYWPAEPTNLSELHLPFLNYLINMATKQPQWKAYAKESGQTKGWTFFTESNIFGGSGLFMHNYTIANAWCCSHLFQHYDYTLDKEFLKRAFPTIWGACEFWLERLVKGSDGTWEAPREYSPEHGPGSSNATAHAQQILVDLFGNTLKAINTLGLEDCGLTRADVDKLQDYYDNLDRGLGTEVYDGKWGATCNGIKSGDVMIREWKYDTYASGQQGHRHMSNFMCLYPYSQIEPGTSIFDAAVKGLLFRGDGATGWSMGWKINLWARAQDGDHARKILRNALCSTHTNGSGVYRNLFDSHSPFQIDGNFGACTGIAEMLLQSRNGGIYLLPALPSLWKAGSMSGLKAAGDVTVGQTWQNGKIATATLVANQGGNLKIGNSDIEHIRVSLNGSAVEKPLITVNAQTGTKTIDFNGLNAGDRIELTYDPDYTNDNTQGAVSELHAANGMQVSVSNGKITVSGVATADISVYDLAGRLVAAASGTTLNVPAGNSVVVVKVTDPSGAVQTLKAAL